jgi:hypothetical protein
MPGSSPALRCRKPGQPERPRPRLPLWGHFSDTLSLDISSQRMYTSSKGWADAVMFSCSAPYVVSPSRPRPTAAIQKQPASLDFHQSAMHGNSGNSCFYDKLLVPRASCPCSSAARMAVARLRTRLRRTDRTQRRASTGYGKTSQAR